MVDRLLSISPNDPRRKEGFVLTQLRALQDLGWAVTAAFASPEPDPPSVEAGIRYIAAPLESPPIPRTPPDRIGRVTRTLILRNAELARAADRAAWKQIVERADPAAILVQFGPTAARLLPVLIQSGRPWVVQFHGYDLTERCRHWGYRLALSSILRHADAVFVCSAFLKRELERRTGSVAARKASIITPGYDEHAFSLAEPRRKVRGQTDVVSVGRLVAVKGHDVAIRSLARAGGEFRLTIVGDGPERSNLERLAVECGVAEQVIFTGALPPAEVASALERAQIFLQLSKTTLTGAREGLGLSPIEAAARGLPLVVSNSGGLGETCIDGETGFVVPEDDPDGALAALRSLSSDLTRARAMGAAGARWVASSFASRVQAGKASEILAGLRPTSGKRAVAVTL